MPKKTMQSTKATKDTKSKTKTAATKRNAKNAMSAGAVKPAAKRASVKRRLKQLETKMLVRLIVLSGVVVLLFGGWLWWQYIYQNPERVFWGTLEQGLSTPGVVKHTQQSGDNGNLDQRVQLALGSQNYVHTLTTVSQPGPNNQQQSVTTETLSTLSAQYVRYTDIKTGTAANGKKPDFSKVQNIWGKTDIDTKAPKSSNRMLTEALIGTVPVGNLTPAQRQELIEMMRSKKVYETDFTVQTRTEGGRKVYVYAVKVQPQAYVGLLRAFAKYVGLGEINGLDPANYKGVPAVPVEFSIDPISRQLMKISYQDGSSRNETYSSYGSLPHVTVPTDTIPMQDLQARTRQIQ